MASFLSVVCQHSHLYMHQDIHLTSSMRYIGMDIETFKLEEWLKKRESKTRFNLAENCVYAVTLDDFFHIARIDKKSFLNDRCV